MIGKLSENNPSSDRSLGKRQSVAAGLLIRSQLFKLFKLCAVLLGCLFFAGCGQPRGFHRPNLVASHGDIIVIGDFMANRLLIADREFNLVRVIAHPHFDTIWGLDADEDTIAVVNERRLGAGGTADEKRSLSLVEIMFFDYSGNLLKSFSWQGGEGPIAAAGSICLGHDGSFVVADSRNHRVVWFNPDGTVRISFGSFGRGEKDLYYPRDARITSEGNLLILDAYSSRLKLFSSHGEFISIVAERGRQAGSVKFPQYASFDADDNLYVTELETMRVSVFDANLRFSRTIEMLDSSDQSEKSLKMLFGVTVLENPREVVVVDSLNSCLYVFDAAGTLLKTITELGSKR